MSKLTVRLIREQASNQAHSFKQVYFKLQVIHSYIKSNFETLKNVHKIHMHISGEPQASREINNPSTKLITNKISKTKWLEFPSELPSLLIFMIPLIWLCPLDKFVLMGEHIQIASEDSDTRLSKVRNKLINIKNISVRIPKSKIIFVPPALPKNANESDVRVVSPPRYSICRERLNLVPNIFRKELLL